MSDYAVYESPWGNPLQASAIFLRTDSHGAWDNAIGFVEQYARDADAIAILQNKPRDDEDVPWKKFDRFEIWHESEGQSAIVVCVMYVVPLSDDALGPAWSRY